MAEEKKETTNEEVSRLLDEGFKLRKEFEEKYTPPTANEIRKLLDLRVD